MLLSLLPIPVVDVDGGYDRTHVVMMMVMLIGDTGGAADDGRGEHYNYGDGHVVTRAMLVMQAAQVVMTMVVSKVMKINHVSSSDGDDGDDDNDGRHDSDGYDGDGDEGGDDDA